MYHALFLSLSVVSASLTGLTVLAHTRMRKARTYPSTAQVLPNR